MKRTLVRASLIALSAALSAAPALAKQPAPAAKSDAAPKAATPAGGAVAVVNGKAIPKSLSDAIIGLQKSQGRPDSEEMRKAVRERLIALEAVAQEAQKKGLDRKAEVQLAQQQVLINAYLADYVKSHPIPEDAVKKAYESYRAVAGNTEYKARHILVEKEDEAKDAIARLRKGEKFADLAKQLSKDPGSKEKGGDLDWAVPATSFVKPFAEALVKLEKGKYTDTPVRSPFGWHVIQLDDTRAFTPPTIEELRPQISQEIQNQLVDQHIAELRQKAKVE